MNKKVIFVSLLDIISIPSGNEHPVDITDFQLKHDFFRALQADTNIVRVNILAYDKNQVMYSNDITFKKMVSVITYEITMYADKAVVPYCSPDNIDDAFVDAAKNTESIEFLKDKSNWLIIGNDDLADKFGVDNITMENFVNVEDLENILKELRQQKRDKHIKPEILTLATIKNRYGKDPLPELRNLWAKGLVKNCKTLNDLGFIYNG